MTLDPYRDPPWAAGNGRTVTPKTLQIGRFECVSAGSFGRLVTVLALLLAAACGGNPEPVPEASPYSDPGFVEAGARRMHYALTMTRDLPSEIAGSYGILQRPNLALLTITLETRDVHAAAPVDTPQLEATRVALTGERQALPLRRFDEPGGPTWLATVEVRHRVPLTIEIRAHATAADPELRARLTREFRLE